MLRKYSVAVDIAADLALDPDAYTTNLGADNIETMMMVMVRMRMRVSGVVMLRTFVLLRTMLVIMLIAMLIIMLIAMH